MPAEHRGAAERPSLAAGDEEVLAAGWEDDVATDDSVLLMTVRNHAEQVRALAVGNSRALLDVPGMVAVCSGVGDPLANVAAASAPLDHAHGRAALESLEAFASHHPGVPFLLYALLGSPDLRTRGHAAVGFPPLMLRVPGMPTPGPPDGVTVDEVSEPAALADFERTVIAGYPLDGARGAPAGAVLPAELLGSGWRFWLARDTDGTPLGTAACFAGHGVQVLEYVAVTEAARGRGIGAAVAGAASTAEPDAPAVLVASDLGRPVYERLGYLTLFRFPVWIVTG